MRARIILGFLVGGLFGFAISGVLHEYTDGVQEERSYCAICGLHRDTARARAMLGDRTLAREYAGGAHSLLREGAGAHAHRFVTPAAVSPAAPASAAPTAATFAREVAREEVRGLDELERQPAALALLADAAREDAARTTALLQRVLDPEAFVPSAAVYLLDRPGWPWAARFRVLDAFLADYRCQREATEVSCTLPQGTGRAVVLRHRAGAASVTELDFRAWTPAGFVPPAARAVPSASANTLVGSSAPSPDTIPSASTDAGTPASADARADDNAFPTSANPAVNTALEALRQHDFRTAVGAYREAAQSASAADIQMLREALRTQVTRELAARITNGNCPGAQGLYRHLHNSGIVGRDFGGFTPACPRP